MNAKSPIITLTCAQCGDPFQMKEWKYEHSLKWGTGRRFCGQRCNGLAKSAIYAARPAPKFSCGFCGKEQTYPEHKSKPGSYVYKQKFCDQHCANNSKKREGSPEIGVISTYGYHVVHRGKKQYAVHRLVMEEHIGRPLRKEETVHHRNGNRADSRIENLELWSSRHGKGQRVTEKVADAIAFLRAYPDEAARQGIDVSEPWGGINIHDKEEYSKAMLNLMSLN